MIKLMKNTFYNEDLVKASLIKFIRNAKQLSMGKKCREFESKFSSYQGRRYAVFFNSGSSANLALLQTLLNLGVLKRGDKIGFSALTWSTSVMPIIELGLTPVAIDVSEKNLNVDIEQLSAVKGIKVLFITNLLGFSGKIDKIKDFCHKNKIILLEDNCEALGSIIEGRRLGSFGLASTFSFFVGHHMSTIEGGMVCTDHKEVYEMLLMVRAHGWSRELEEESKEKLKKVFGISDFYDKYTFYNLGYNLRPTEINGFLGCEQIIYLDEICKKREKNFRKYEEAARKNNDFARLDFSHMEFISNFAYPIICKDKETLSKYIGKFNFAGIEIRPIVGGSMVEQPFFKGKKDNCENAKKVHSLGFYLPNNPDLTKEEVEKICDLLRG